MKMVLKRMRSKVEVASNSGIQVQTLEQDAPATIGLNSRVVRGHPGAYYLAKGSHPRFVEVTLKDRKSDKSAQIFPIHLCVVSILDPGENSKG